MGPNEDEVAPEEKSGDGVPKEQDCALEVLALPVSVGESCSDVASKGLKSQAGEESADVHGQELDHVVALQKQLAEFRQQVSELRQTKRGSPFSNSRVTAQEETREIRADLSKLRNKLEQLDNRSESRSPPCQIGEKFSN